jgi:hypothetical protein
MTARAVLGFGGGGRAAAEEEGAAVGVYRVSHDSFRSTARDVYMRKHTSCVDAASFAKRGSFIMPDCSEPVCAAAFVSIRLMAMKL